jgi:Xaa-Pro aminopeptidase
MDKASLTARRDRVSRTWGLSRGAVIVPSGLPVPIEGTDQAHDFHAHAEHYYLSGAAAPGTVLTFDPGEGWTLFAPVASREERVWVGDGVDMDELGRRAGLDRVLPAERLGAWLESRRGEPLALIGNHDIEVRPREYGVANWPALEVEIDESLSSRLSDQVSESRRAKDAGEIALMREAVAATGPGHLAGMRLARPGMTERELQIEIEAEFFRAGSERTAYGSIVGSGPNASILHFAPSGRAFRDGDIVLVDAAAEREGYAADVTRTFPVRERFSGIQRDLYALVLGVQDAAIRAVRPGAEYRDLHLAASRRVAEGLVQLGILRGDPDSLVERDAHAIFFPHGLGHMLGLATHDAGGCLAGREPSDRFGLKWLRADLPLEPGYVVTIEPGIYFIRALLTDPEQRRIYGDAVNWDRVDTLLDFGGIRIEDDVLVTASGADVLSAAIPKAINDIEALRREATRA